MLYYALMEGIHRMNAAQAFLRRRVRGLCWCCSLRPNRQMAHGLQMAEIAEYKKRKADKQQQEQLAKKKNWGNVMHYKNV